MVYLLQIEADSLATLGLFTYLGRRTRIFLSAMGIKDLDGVIMNFLRLISLLVCYILTIPIFKILILILILKIQCFYFSYWNVEFFSYIQNFPPFECISVSWRLVSVNSANADAKCLFYVGLKCR